MMQKNETYERNSTDFLKSNHYYLDKLVRYYSVIVLLFFNTQYYRLLQEAIKLEKKLL